MVPEVSPVVWSEVLASCLVLSGAIGWAVWVTVRKLGMPPKVPVLYATAIGGWLVAMFVLGGLEVFRAADNRIPLLGLGVAIPVAAGVVALARSNSLRRLIDATPPAWLVLPHVLRFVGIVFIVLAAGNQLPELFAYTAGIGDALVAAAAIPVAWALLSKRPWSRGTLLGFNVVGLVDFVGALGTGFFAAPSPLRLFYTTPSTELLSVLPMVLIPTFMVPAFILLHIFSLHQLRSGTLSARTARPAGRISPMGTGVA